MIDEKANIPRDDAEDRNKRTIVHETIPGERQRPSANKQPLPGGKEGDGPGTARSTADEDLN
ncbi:MAG TPA: hypothetical protein VHL60_03305 [Oxalicibacterium sp.]|jgi:hypothetical protein|nr:hypothetical protein [Oxalicibacterium sp.]